MFERECLKKDPLPISAMDSKATQTYNSLMFRENTEHCKLRFLWIIVVLLKNYGQIGNIIIYVFSIKQKRISFPLWCFKFFAPSSCLFIGTYLEQSTVDGDSLYFWIYGQPKQYEDLKSLTMQINSIYSLMYIVHGEPKKSIQYVQNIAQTKIRRGT